MKVQVHILHNVLPRPDRKREMLINDPSRVVIISVELLAENIINLRPFSPLSVKQQFRRRASARIDHTGKAGSLPLKRHAVCPSKRKAASETTSECAQHQGVRNRTNEENSCPRNRTWLC